MSPCLKLPRRAPEGPAKSKLGFNTPRIWGLDDGHNTRPPAAIRASRGALEAALRRARAHSGRSSSIPAKGFSRVPKLVALTARRVGCERGRSLHLRTEPHGSGGDPAVGNDRASRVHLRTVRLDCRVGRPPPLGAGRFRAHGRPRHGHRGGLCCHGPSRRCLVDRRGPGLHRPGRRQPHRSARASLTNYERTAAGQSQRETAPGEFCSDFR